jgi:hypothetical protein
MNSNPKLEKVNQVLKQDGRSEEEHFRKFLEELTLKRQLPSFIQKLSLI